jgi:hypothetical protein
VQEDVRKKGREASAKAKQARADAFALEMQGRLSGYAGYSLSSIARDLNAKRVPTASGKGSWTAKAVSNLQARISALHQNVPGKSEEEAVLWRVQAQAKIAAMAEASAAARARLGRARAEAAKTKKDVD